MSTRSRLFGLCLAAALACCAPALAGEPSNLRGNTVFTAVGSIVRDPATFKGSFISLKATFLGWKADQDIGAPPVTRSDWIVRGEDGSNIYCTGRMPEGLRPSDPEARGIRISLLGQVMLTPEGKPFIIVSEATPLVTEPEPMIAVSQILFDPIGMKGRTIGLLGVLAKGFDQRGRRFYLLADPTGAITLDRLPKLYPRGTILQIKGTVDHGENGLPMLTGVEIVSAKP